MLNFEIRKKYFTMLAKKISDIYEIITGIPPLSMPNSKGKNLKSYSISGNVDEEIIEYSDGTAIEGKPNLLRTLGRTEQAITGSGASVKRILQGDKWAKLTASNNVCSLQSVTLGNGSVSFSTLTDDRGVGFSVKLKPNHSYTVYSDVATSDTAYKMGFRILFYAADGTWLSRQYSNAASSGKVLKNFAVPSNADMTVILCAKSIGTSANTPTLTFSNIMLVEGVYTTSNAPAYTPYKQLLTDCNGVGDKTKNLLRIVGRTQQTGLGAYSNKTPRNFDLNKYAYIILANNYYSETMLSTTLGETFSFPNSTYGGLGIPVQTQAGTTYSISAYLSSSNASVTCKINTIYYGNQGLYIGSNVSVTNSTVTGTIFGTFTPPENSVLTVLMFTRGNSTSYGETIITASNVMLVEGSYTLATMPTYEPYGYKIPVLSGGGDTSASTTVTNAQIEIGSEKTEYEPYIAGTSNNIFINNSLYKTGENSDKINYPQNKTVKAVGKYVFTGTETIELYDNSKGFRFAVSDMETGNCIDGFCNRFENFKNMTDNNVPRVFFGYNNNYVYFRRFSDTATTVEAIKATLADWYNTGKPLTIWYPLEDEAEEAVTLPDIPTVQGNATIIVDTSVQPSEMSVEYAIEGA